MNITQCFNIKKGDIITVTGGGGKTSLIFHLARELSKHSKVLITTTTKIYEPQKFQYEELILVSSETIKGSGTNIFILGDRIDIKTGKLIGICDKIIEEYKDKYDYILIEGDGSNGKPLKYWNEYEPVISKFSTKIIGVTNLDALGKEILEATHRGSKLCKQHKWSENNKIDLEKFGHYLLKGDFFRGFDFVKNKNNMEKIFFINGVEGLDKLNFALELGNFLRDNNREEKIVIGSFVERECYSYKKIISTLLASGFSKRFGEDKLLFKYENKTLLEKSLENIEGISFFKKQIVIREDKKKLKIIKKLEEKIKWKVLINSEAHLGQSSGIKLGIKNLNKDESMMFFTGDQHFLTKETILKIIKSYLKEEKITIPYVENESFSPNIFPPEYKARLESICGDKGGKSILNESDKINKIMFKDKIIFFDIDTQNDLEILKDEILKNKK
ncbi:MAG: selenium cofactor biosynthesis protein YqeC [Fusobacteriaceae bacterium]